MDVVASLRGEGSSLARCWQNTAPIITDPDEHLSHTGEKMWWSGNRNMLSARAGECLRKRLQHVANADADIAVWLWKLLYTTIRNEGCRRPPPTKEHHSILVGVLVDKMLLVPGSQTSLTHITLHPLLMLWLVHSSPSMLLQITLGLCLQVQQRDESSCKQAKPQTNQTDIHLQAEQGNWNGSVSISTWTKLTN